MVNILKHWITGLCLRELILTQPKNQELLSVGISSEAVKQRYRRVVWDGGSLKEGDSQTSWKEEIESNGGERRVGRTF